MIIENKLSAAWNKFFGLKSPKFLIQPFFDCFRAGFEAGLQDEWTFAKPREVEVLKRKLEEALRQRDFYAAWIPSSSTHQKERFEKLLEEIK